MLGESGDDDVDQDAPFSKKKAALPPVPAPQRISKFPLLPIGGIKCNAPP